MRDRKDLVMRNQRSFSIEYKRQVVEELLSGGRVVLPNSAADITFQRACFIIGRGNTAGANSTMNPPRRLLLRIE